MKTISSDEDIYIVGFHWNGIIAAVKSVTAGEAASVKVRLQAKYPVVKTMEKAEYETAITEDCYARAVAEKLKGVV